MGAGNSTAQKLEMAQKTGVFGLRDAGISEVPEKVFAVKNLRVLDLSQNKLLKLPAAVGRLSGTLKDLSIDRNKLKALPDALATLAKLESLSAANNSLASLPDAFGALGKLKKLTLSGNALRALPESMCACAALVTLDVSGNALGALPAGFGALASLVSADCSNNRIGALPAGLEGLRRLKELDLRSNAPLVVLGALPPELCLSTPLHRLELDQELLGPDGLLLPSAAGGEEAHEAYVARRKARIDKELAAKQRGGDMSFGQ